MTGRGIDQVLAHPSDPRLHESCVRSARGYVELAQRAHGAIGERHGASYIWGEALAQVERLAPDVRIANLETAVTTRDAPWPGKGIHYRMHPRNVAVLTAAGLDCCVLANNHVMDWGRDGLLETLAVLRAAGIATAGAGADAREAAAPARIGNVRVHAFALEDSGVPRDWAAKPSVAGVNLLPDLSEATLEATAGRIAAGRAPGDIDVASIHWGGNWGYDIAPAQRRFAHGLVERGGVAVVHGHSSHHPKGFEVHRGGLILYGCGDLVNDYEGITGWEEYRPGLAWLYLAALDAGGALQDLELVPYRMRRFRLERPPEEARHWLAARTARECARLGTRLETVGDRTAWVP